MQNKLREVFGAATVNGLTRQEAINIARITIDAYLRGKIIANGVTDGEP